MSAEEDLYKALEEIAELKRVVANMVRIGTVTEVKSGGGERKVRVAFDVDAQGQPVPGPWSHTSDPRGEDYRAETHYKKGMTVVAICHGGDPRNIALMLPGPEYEKGQRPDNAEDDATTQQFGKQAFKKHKDGLLEWVIGEEQQQQQQSQQQQTSGMGGAGQQEKTEMQAKGQKPKAKGFVRLEKSAGFTGKMGNSRCAARDQGAKIKTAGHAIFTTSGGCFTTHPIELVGDSIPDDNS